MSNIYSHNGVTVRPVRLDGNEYVETTPDDPAATFGIYVEDGEGLSMWEADVRTEANARFIAETLASARESDGMGYVSDLVVGDVVEVPEFEPGVEWEVTAIEEYPMMDLRALTLVGHDGRRGVFDFHENTPIIMVNAMQPRGG